MRVEQLIEELKKIPPMTPVVISEPILDDMGELIDVSEHDVHGVQLRAGVLCPVAEIELVFSKTWMNQLSATVHNEEQS